MWRFTLPEAQNVRISVYNAIGQEVRVLVNGQKAAGQHTITWDGADENGRVVASGTYIYVLATDTQRLVGRLTMIR